RGALDFGHGRPQSPMFSLEQLFIRGPCRLVELALFRTREKVAAFQRKRTAFAPPDPPPQRVFPVRCVQRHFPDIVAARSWPPGSLPRRHTLQGLSQIGAMPGLSFVGFIEKREYELVGIHGGHLQKGSSSFRQSPRKRIARLIVRVNARAEVPLRGG